MLICASGAHDIRQCILCIHRPTDCEHHCPVVVINENCMCWPQGSDIIMSMEDIMDAPAADRTHGLDVRRTIWIVHGIEARAMGHLRQYARLNCRLMAFQHCVSIGSLRIRKCVQYATHSLCIGTLMNVWLRQCANDCVVCFLMLCSHKG